MQGTILIIDGMATNRIMLKVQLSAAYYHVVQAEGMQGIMPLVERCQPDLILVAMSLPDGGAIRLHRVLQQSETTSQIPVIAIAPQNDRAALLMALSAGIDDVLIQPVDDLILQARIRSLIRSRSSAEDLRLRDGASQALGFSEPAASLVAPAQIALVARDVLTATRWRAQLQDRIPHQMHVHRMDDIHALMADPVADAFVVEVTGNSDQAGLRLTADLHARSATRNAPVIAVTDPPNATRAAEALDRGAHDVMPNGFCAEELALRLWSQLRHKASSDRLRASVRDGLRAAILDPMTGLYNRRYALPHLEKVVRQSRASDRPFAVMLVDLDHFKRINDRYGHPSGDAVLTETALRLRSQLRPADMIARMGGEEFMIVMPDTTREHAIRSADRLCRQINSRPFRTPHINQPISLTISIGVVVGGASHGNLPDGENCAAALIGQADRALYEAKGSGRNQFTLTQDAA
ncbi:diguanylate cyclase [Arenibacterium sp. CAU 1754]